MDRSRLRSHLSGSVPISIAIHVVVLLLLVAIPLLANVVIPTIAYSMPDIVHVTPVPPPPPVAIARTSPAPRLAPSNTAPAPTIAPEAIHPESTEPRPAFDPGPRLDATSGLPPDSGALPIGSGISVPQPPAPPRPAGPVRVADLPVAPRKIADARPVYPEIARTARVEGTIVMEAVLDPSGMVTQLRIVRSVPLLDQAAMDAVRQWRYTPSHYNGRPVSVLMTITIRFTLQ